MELSKDKQMLLRNIKNIKLAKLPIVFDITTLNMIIWFIYKDSVLRTRKTLNNIYKLFKALDITKYESNSDLRDRVWIILKSLQARLSDGYESNAEFLISYISDDVECDDNKKRILDDIPYGKISHEESKYLIKKLDDTLNYGYVVSVKDIFKEVLNNIEDGDFKSYKSVQEDLYMLATSIINIKRNTSTLGSDLTFSLSEDIFENVIEESVQELKDRNRIFRTGIQRLNTLLSPGYQSKRLYTYLAFPAKGKSTMLLKSALDIRQYNQNIQTKDPDKRPAVLLLILENGVSETVERLYNMTVEGDDIRNYSTKQVIRRLRKEGNLALNDKNNIDLIIKAYKNRELDTNDLYGIINDLNDEGIEVVTLLIDYLKRLRPAERANEERHELRNITNELKELAKYFDIPVITAQQLNRSGAAVVDAAMQDNKADVTRLVGSHNIAGAWEIQENSDFTCIINKEVKQDTGDLYMTFKLLKRRYRSSETDEKLRRLDYFNHPFEEGDDIRLIDDIYLPESLSIDSLSTKFVAAADEKRGKKSTVERTEVTSKKKKDSVFDDIGEFEPFDMSCSKNF